MADFPAPAAVTPGGDRSSKRSRAAASPSTSSRYTARPARAAPSPKRKRPEPEPPLPPRSRPATVDSLHPAILHKYRLSLMHSLGRAPSDADLDRCLASWLKREYREREERIAGEIARTRRAQEMRDKLDLAWEWQRQAEEQAGIPRTDDQRRRDEVVKARLLRRREEKLEHERQREAALLAAAEARAKGASDSDSADDEWANAPEWKRHQRAMKRKFPEGWAPPKRISREAMDLMRTLARSDPAVYTVQYLATKFKSSPEAVRRILKSKFQLAPEEQARREAKRKEARRRGEGAATAGSGPGSTWEGDLAAQGREMRELRQKRDSQREAQ
ncbi:mitochondrial ribosome assembly protein RRG9 [Rhodotorula paludigena]|uniref:mitochondrial ribosome assembly protein RRG9 n=1 Tax=Rhodotorula paludigena TaxID=86838 RepID=UPI00317AA23C